VKLKKRLLGQGVEGQRVDIDVAAHSPMVEPILDAFREFIKQIPLRPPTRPFVSNVTGSWITDSEATSPEYWVQHIRQTVRFSDGIATLLGETEAAMLEVGPGKTLGSLTRQHPECSNRPVVNSVRHPREEADDHELIMSSVGDLWAGGVSIQWEQLHEVTRCRIPLPQYPFERKSYWIERPSQSQQSRPKKRGRLQKRPDLTEWLYVPSWKRTAVPSVQSPPKSEGQWLVFEDKIGFAEELLERIQQLYLEGYTEKGYTLQVDEPGELGSLSLQPSDRRAPGPGEIEIRVHAAALQFKDVLMALGLYADDPVPMGAECAGTVVCVGEGVSGFEVATMSWLRDSTAFRPS
jgi:acyl transferase domain-containing protein